MFENSTTPPRKLFDTVVRLSPGGIVDVDRRENMADAVWTDEWIVTAFHADSDQAVHPDVWERHPAGQEVLCVLSGAVNVYLRDHDVDDEPTATVAAGEAFVVPRGAWHRLSVEQPGDLLSLTPPAGTEHEPVTVRRHVGDVQ